MKFVSVLDHTPSLFISSMVHISPQKWIKVDKWGCVLSGWQELKPTSLPLISWMRSAIYSALFSRITSFPDSKLIHHQGVLVTEQCVPFSADQWASEGKACKIVWDCQSCCKCDPFKAKHLQTSVVLWDIIPLPIRIFEPNSDITFLRENMGEEIEVALLE